MIVAGVERQQLLVGDRVAQVELVRADHVGFRADAEQFALDGVEIMGRIDRRGEQFVQRPFEYFPRPAAVDRHVLHAVGNPDVGDAGGAQAAAKGLADLAAGDGVLDPEAADAGVAMGQRETVGRLGMRKERGVEVQADAQLGRPVDPAPKVLGGDLVPLDRPAAVLQVDRVQAEAMPAGDEAECLGRVGAKLVGVACPAGVVAGGHDAAAAQSAGALESGHVVPLPALDGNGNAFQMFDRGIEVDVPLGITLLGEAVRFFNGRGGHGNPHGKNWKP